MTLANIIAQSSIGATCISVLVFYQAVKNTEMLSWWKNATRTEKLLCASFVLALASSLIQMLGFALHIFVPSMYRTLGSGPY